MGLQTRIGPLACRLGFWPRGGDGEEGGEEEEEGEISPMCESIGHRPKKFFYALGYPSGILTHW